MSSGKWVRDGVGNYRRLAGREVSVGSPPSATERAKRARGGSRGPSTPQSDPLCGSFCCAQDDRFELLAGGGGGEFEVDAAVVVRFAGGGEVDIGKWDFPGAAWGEIEECVSDNGVVDHIGTMAVFENEDG